MGSQHATRRTPTAHVRSDPLLDRAGPVDSCAQGDRGLSLADTGGLDIEGERGRCHIHAAATPLFAFFFFKKKKKNLRCVLPPLDTPDAPVAEIAM